ncbi:MAG: hypothetical protein F6K11_14100 [Leptolyngbya sp. SIO3F4]|nr:hypothetical protein [Leptolyngbya sp. SIO3F4]
MATVQNTQLDSIENLFVDLTPEDAQNISGGFATRPIQDDFFSGVVDGYKSLDQAIRGPAQGIQTRNSEMQQVNQLLSQMRMHKQGKGTASDGSLDSDMGTFLSDKGIQVPG